jgi:hypothetical protein
VSSFSEFYISSGKQGGAAVLGEWHEIVTGETCVPASLNVNNSEKQLFAFPSSMAGAVPILAYCL